VTIAAPRDPAAPQRFSIVSPSATLVVLTLINFLNYVDRQILAPLIPFLQAAPSDGGLGLSGTQAGLLHTAFMIVHSIASIPLGILADRWLRPRVIAIGVGLWSIATAAAGFARSYPQLFLGRALVGIGEAAYAPAASSLISDRFRPEQRARALGVFQLGMLLGTAIGVIVGALVAGRYGWRAAFFVVGLPGVVLTIAALALRDAPRPPREPGPGLLRLVLSPPHRELRPALFLIYASGILITFFVGAVALWGIDFVVDYHYAGDPAHTFRASLLIGTVGVVAGAGGAVVGSIVGDRIERRRPGGGRLLAIGAGALIGAPIAALALIADDLGVTLVALGVGVFFISWYIGPVVAVLHDVVPPRFRATATGAYLALVHALGDGISPGMVGVVKDHASLRIGLLLALIPMALGGVTALVAIRFTTRIAAQH